MESTYDFDRIYSGNPIDENHKTDTRRPFAIMIDLVAEDDNRHKVHCAAKRENPIVRPSFALAISSDVRIGMN